MHSLMVRPEAMQAESARHSRRMAFWVLQLEDISSGPLRLRGRGRSGGDPRLDTRPYSSHRPCLPEWSSENLYVGLGR